MCVGVTPAGLKAEAETEAQPAPAERFPYTQYSIKKEFLNQQETPFCGFETDFSYFVVVRSSTRRIFPDVVFGSSSINSMIRGYL